MTESVISLKRESEELIELRSILAKIELPKGDSEKIKAKIEHIKSYKSTLSKLEIKDRLVLLAHLLAQFKIALITNDEEKLNHVISKFIHSDVCNLEGIERDIKCAKEIANKMHNSNQLNKTLDCYEKIFDKIKKEFEMFMKIINGEEELEGSEMVNEELDGYEEEFDGNN